MAICVISDTSGNLSRVDASSGICPGYWLVTPDDKIAFLERIFDPSFLSPENYQVLFSLGFSMPLVAYLTAWAFQTVVSFINHKD